MKKVSKLSAILGLMGVANETLELGMRYWVGYRGKMHAATRYVKLSLYVKNYKPTDSCAHDTFYSQNLTCGKSVLLTSFLHRKNVK
jgi:hypothetical protein